MNLTRHLGFKTLAILPLAFASAAFAGADVTAPSAKDPSPAISPTLKEEWQVTAWAYGWLAGLEGTTGIKGFKSEVDVPFSKILDNLDMTAAITLEARKGRWGGWIDGMYLKVSAGGNTPGPLLSNVNVSVEQIVAEAAVFYRVWEGQRGSLDLYAGARYMRMSGELGLAVSDSGVQQVSEELSSRVVDEVVSAVKTKTATALAATKAKLASQIADTARAQLASTVAEKATAARTVLDNLQEIAAAHPALVTAIKKSSRLQNAIKAEASARIDQQLADSQAQLAAAQSTATAAAQAAQAAAAAAAASAQSAAKKAVSKAEKALASEIERALRDGIPTELSGTKSWVDPFIGARAYYHFTDRFYGIAKADIGGFGISSDLAWQAYAAFGYNLTKSATIELGYKYMAVDYTSGGFTNDTRTSGVFLNLGLKL